MTPLTRPSTAIAFLPVHFDDQASSTCLRCCVHLAESGVSPRGTAASVDSGLVLVGGDPKTDHGVIDGDFPRKGRAGNPNCLSLFSCAAFWCVSVLRRFREHAVCSPFLARQWTHAFPRIALSLARLWIPERAMLEGVIPFQAGVQ